MIKKEGSAEESVPVGSFQGSGALFENFKPLAASLSLPRSLCVFVRSFFFSLFYFFFYYYYSPGFIRQCPEEF